MTVLMPYIPPNVYLLADNLDAALAAGEDIMKATLHWGTGSDRDGSAIASKRAAQRAVLENVRTLEQVLVARVLKSRERSEEIAKRDPRFATVARLYNAGTAILIEAVSDFGDPSSIDFENGGGAVAYLRTRGLLTEDAPGPSDGQTFKFRDSFLVAGRIRLGTLLDLVAMYLDTLETHFDLFSDAAAEPDLMPGEVDPDAVAANPDADTAIAATQEDEDDSNSTASDDETASADVDSLRDALLEVRNLVALDQR
jgi:hypothetical protein